MLFLRVKNLLVFLVICCCAAGYVSGKEVSSTRPSLHSPYVAGVFHDIALEKLNDRRASNADIELGMVFLIAATELDSRSSFVNETMLRAGPLLLDDKHQSVNCISAF